MATTALNPDAFTEFTVKEVKPYNHDSAVVVFDLPRNAQPGLRVASAVLFTGAGEGIKDKEGKPVMRPYTPISTPETAGHMDFLIKKYKDGLMTSHVHGLKPGDKINIKGPIDTYKYTANSFETIALIAGGSGITPMWQLIQQIAEDKSEKTKVTFIYANKTEEDILLRSELDQLAKSNDRFKVIYGISGDSSIAQFKGHVTADVLKKYLPSPNEGEKIKIFVCGPPGQMKAISGMKDGWSQGELSGVLAELNYQASQVHKF